jgi:alanine racemase
MMRSTGLLTVNLSALSANWLLLNKRVQQANADSQCAAVVKANAYGLGLEPVALALHAVGCRQFFVATLQEAIALRGIIGDDGEIIVLGGLAHGAGGEWQQYQLIPVLYDIKFVDQWVEYCQQRSVALPCVFKVDTGMHRLGLQPDDLKGLCQREDVQRLNVKMLMSHLACADTPSHKLNRRQLQEFRQISALFREYFPQSSLSLANSSGLFLGDDFYFDIARPGAALYGVNPTPALTNPMQPVVNLSLPVMQIRTIKSGESVGYGATFVAQRKTRMAVVFGGYADGLIRLMGGRGKGYCNGEEVPIIGRVSMDSMAVDITDLDAEPSSIQILNEIQGVDVLAAFAETIGYEVLTNLGARFKREYIQNPAENPSAVN